MSMSNVRRFEPRVFWSWLAKYSRTSTGIPDVTGKLQAISVASAGSMRLDLNKLAGVVDGTVEPNDTLLLHDWIVSPPLTRNGEGVFASSADQSGAPEL